MSHACCHASHGTAPPPAQDPAIAIDPVCGMKVKIEGAKNTTVHEGQTYYFCSAGCKQAFDKNPEKYVKSGQGGHGEQHSEHGHHRH